VNPKPKKHAVDELYRRSFRCKKERLKKLADLLFWDGTKESLEKIRK
jgi:hypothetical protein